MGLWLKFLHLHMLSNDRLAAANVYGYIAQIERLIHVQDSRMDVNRY